MDENLIAAMEKPPAPLKFFAPNGDTKEMVGWLGLRRRDDGLVRVFYLNLVGEVLDLNPRVVVYDQAIGKVIYSPRDVKDAPSAQALFSEKEKKWLKENPSWPKILELDDFMVSEDEKEDQNGIGSD